MNTLHLEVAALSAEAAGLGAEVDELSAEAYLVLSGASNLNAAMSTVV